MRRAKSQVGSWRDFLAAWPLYPEIDIVGDMRADIVFFSHHCRLRLIKPELIGV
jgi:hypothetical protein